MEAGLTGAELTYDVNFSSLSFNLPGLGATLLKSIYENVNPRFAINTGDMRVLSGNSLSDVHIGVALFNGFGNVDVRPDGMSMSFRGLQKPGDFGVCMNCIALCEKAVRATVPDYEVGVIAFRPTLFLELADGTNASAHLAEAVGTMERLDLGGFGNVAQHHGVNLDIESKGEGWNAIFNAYRDRTEETSLVASIYVVYREDGAIRGLEQRAGHLERLTRTLLYGIGLEVPDLFWEAA